MPRVEIVTVVSGRDSREMYELLCDTARFAQFTKSIESLHIERRRHDGGQHVARALPQRNPAVDRGRRLRPRAADDRVRPARRRLRELPRMLDVEPLAHGSPVRFATRFDFGMPTLAPMIDPLAEVALRASIGEIVSGLATTPRIALDEGPAVTR